MFEWLLDLIGYEGEGHGLNELSRRLGISVASLQAIEPSYREFSIPKRSGGVRHIAAPEDDLKSLQRCILRRLLSRLRIHPAATGFERRQSIVDNARQHVAKAVVIHFDIKEFFPSISADRVRRYLRAIGWNRKSARLLVKLLTWHGRLPQGAPTSPRISNLVNYRMDARLSGLAKRYNANYTRYADDITLSLDNEAEDVHPLIAAVISILQSEGYQPHLRKKFDVRRRHQRQEVTGLVVNSRVNLPRARRRWLRAVEHRMRQSAQSLLAAYDSRIDRFVAKRPSISKEQLDGWHALVRMIERQRTASEEPAQPAR